MWKRRSLVVVLALAVLVPFVISDAQAAKGGKKKPPPEPPPPANPVIAYRVEGGNKKRPGGLFVMNADGTNPLRIGSLAFDSSWAPDRTQIALDRGPGNTWLAAVDGSGQELFIPGGADPEWSPLGTHIACAGNLWARLDLVALAGGATTTLHSVTGPDDWILSPTWRADGSAIAFLEHVPPTPMQVRVVELSTGVITTLGALDVSWIEWARTKDVLLYATAGKVYTLDMVTGVSTYVVDGASASWSPDDTQIVYEKSRAIYVHTFATGTSVRLRNGRFPRWAR